MVHPKACIWQKMILTVAPTSLLLAGTKKCKYWQIKFVRFGLKVSNDDDQMIHNLLWNRKPFPLLLRLMPLNYLIIPRFWFIFIFLPFHDIRLLFKLPNLIFSWYLVALFRKFLMWDGTYRHTIRTMGLSKWQEEFFFSSDSFHTGFFILHSHVHKTYEVFRVKNSLIDWLTLGDNVKPVRTWALTE